MPFSRPLQVLAALASAELQGEVDVTMGVFMVEVPEVKGPVQRPVVWRAAPVGVGVMAMGAYLWQKAPRPLPHVVQEGQAICHARRPLAGDSGARASSGPSSS